MSVSTEPKYFAVGDKVSTNKIFGRYYDVGHRTGIVCQVEAHVIIVDFGSYKEAFSASDLILDKK